MFDEAGLAECTAQYPDSSEEDTKKGGYSYLLIQLSTPINSNIFQVQDVTMERNFASGSATSTKREYLRTESR